MNIRLTETKDWRLLKQIRLAALLDAPTAFGVSYQTAANYTDDQWKERASSTGTQFWLALKDDQPVGMIGAGVSQANRFNLIGMWVEPAARGSGVVARLVEAVKTRSMEKGHDRVYLDVSPDLAADEWVSPDVKQAPAIYPPKTVLKKLFTVEDLPPAIARLTTRLWNKLKTNT